MDHSFMPLVLDVLKSFCLAFVISAGFGMYFNAPKRTLPVAGLLGGMGYCIRLVLQQYLYQDLISSTFFSCILIGVMGIYLAHKVHTPPVIFTIPACVPMIPGLYAYRTMLSAIKITDKDTYKKDPFLLFEMFHNAAVTTSLLFCLSIGLSITVLVFRKKSVKTISFPKKEHLRIRRRG